MIENEIASGISASATTSPARTSVRSSRGDRSVVRTEESGVGAVGEDAVETGTNRKPTLT